MINWFHDLSDTLKHWIDAIAIGVVAASVIKALPALAAALSIVWTALRIWESRTVTSWWMRWRRGKEVADGRRIKKDSTSL